jgi:hypothetical protein
MVLWALANFFHFAIFGFGLLLLGLEMFEMSSKVPRGLLVRIDPCYSREARGVFSCPRSKELTWGGGGILTAGLSCNGKNFMA